LSTIGTGPIGGSGGTVSNPTQGSTPPVTFPGSPIPGSTGSTTSSGNSLIDSLTGANRDAAVFLTNLFTSYGLGTLAPKIVEFLKDGYSSDTIALLLQKTDEYKARFPANTARLAAGLPVLSPAEYISTENAYRQILSSAGLPPTFYDSSDDFSKWIAGDVSPTEIHGRVQVASDLITNADPNTLAAFRNYYTHGDLIAYALDPKTAEPILEKQYKAAQIAGAAGNNGVAVGQTQAESLAGAGITQQQAGQGFGQIGQDQGTVNKLDQIYGGDVSTEDLINSVFLNQADASKRLEGLASQERAQFGGTTAVGQGSLSKRDAGQL
jgi:hypothetical protein